MMCAVHVGGDRTDETTTLPLYSTALSGLHTKKALVVVLTITQ